MATDIIGKEGAVCFWAVGFCFSSRIALYLWAFFAYGLLSLHDVAAANGRLAQLMAFYLAKKLAFARLKPSSLTCIKPGKRYTVCQRLMNGVQKAPLASFPLFWRLRVNNYIAQFLTFLPFWSMASAV